MIIMPRTGLTRVDIATAYDALVDAGLQPSIRAIRKRLDNTGRLKTIADHVRALKTERWQAPGPALPDTLLQSLVSDEFACGYKIKDVLVLPKSFTKGARAMAAIGNKTNERTSVRFTVAEFDRLVKQLPKMPSVRKSWTLPNTTRKSRNPVDRHASCH